MYINARDILPRDLLKQIQKYVQGLEIYIPKVSDNCLGWGEKNGTRHRLQKRNQEIASRYEKGASVQCLMDEYHLSYDTIRRIIREGRKQRS